jgi:hypothetical protein
MSNALLVRRRRRMIRVPAALWKRETRRETQRAAARLAFMDPDHRLIRNFVVTEIARRGEPVDLGAIVEATGIEPNRVLQILDELEAHLTFLYRTDGENVDWAYPVAAHETPHRVTLDSGDRFFAA